MIRTLLFACAIAIGATAASAQTGRPAAATTAASPTPIQGFSVVLVVGSQRADGQTFGADLPRAATKALSDLSDFLPYQSYRLLDSAWLLNSGTGRASSRLRGLDSRSYDIVLETSAVAARFGLRFALSDGESAVSSESAPDAASVHQTEAMQAETDAMRARLVELERQLELRRKGSGARDPELIKTLQQYEEAQRRYAVLRTELDRRKKSLAAAGTRIIDTSFTMDAGETVVVGTSRLQGDTALIALLTAVPRTTK